jgi:Cys-tRNA(Pro)/Cys-tRNA(Cys) deacylase
VIIFDRLVRILDKSEINYNIIGHCDITNVKDGIKAFKCDSSQVVKTLGFKIDGMYIFFAIRRDKRLDFKKIAALLNVSRQKISQISVDEPENDLGYKAGGLSPLHIDSSNIAVYFDGNILDIDTVYCGIGLKNKTLEIKSIDLLKISNAVLCDIVKLGTNN